MMNLAEFKNHPVGYARKVLRLRLRLLRTKEKLRMAGSWDPGGAGEKGDPTTLWVTRDNVTNTM